MAADRKPAIAEGHFERAMRVARQQKGEVVRTAGATGIARLWGDGGKAATREELLGRLLAQFREGFDTRDLVEAKVLLDTLQQW